MSPEKMHYPSYRSHHGGLSLDTVVAVLVFSLSSLLSAFAYSLLLKTDIPAAYFSGSLQKGEHHFALLKEQQCIGILQTELTNENTYHLRIHAELALELNKHSLDSNLDFAATFNPIGQMLESKSSLRLPGSMVEMRSEGIQEMHIKLHGRIEGRGFGHEFKVPGPFLIEKSSADVYGIHYSGFDGGGAPLFAALKSSLQALPSFKVQDLNAADSKSCALESRARIDVSPLFAGLAQQQNNLNSLTGISNRPPGDPL